MVSNVLSFGTNGLKAFLIKVESDVSRGIPDFEIIGLGDAAIKESRKRIWSALKNQSFDFPLGKVIVNLAPAATRKMGAGLDLPIAVGILAAEGVLRPGMLTETAVIGELSLEGNLHPVNGILSMIEVGRKEGIRRFIVPKENAAEATLARDVNICGASSLRQAVTMLAGHCPGTYTGEGIAGSAGLLSQWEYDFSQIAGQHACKRALEIAAAGGHNLLMLGAAGCGKSLLAHCLPGILPPLEYEESFENTAIYSMAGKLDRHMPLMTARPFRKIQSAVSLKGLTGGGRPVNIGEATLANHGVLFFDEITEAERKVIEALREPLENGCIQLSMAGISETLPADFIFIAAGNPCKCGKLFEEGRKCTCTRAQIRTRMGRLSVPFMDRIDMHVIVRSLGFSEMSEAVEEEPSREIRKRVLKARAVQKKRYQGDTILVNAHMSRSQIGQYCRLDKFSSALIEEAVIHTGLSMRSYDRIVKVARTIADLAGEKEIGEEHVAEAFQYRCLDRFQQNL